jgi:hypothetical protein
VFGDILTFFEKRNNWVGWACFLLMYTANISLFMPGILLMMGAGVRVRVGALSPDSLAAACHAQIIHYTHMRLPPDPGLPPAMLGSSVTHMRLGVSKRHLPAACRAWFICHTHTCVEARPERHLPGACRFWKALLAVWIGGGIGQVMAFLLARYLIRDFITALLRGKSRKWDIVRSPPSPVLCSLET